MALQEQCSKIIGAFTIKQNKLAKLGIAKAKVISVMERLLESDNLKIDYWLG